MDALSEKENSDRKVKALTMTIRSHLSMKIKEAQLEALKLENVAGETLRGMEKNFEIKGDRVRYFMNQIWTTKFSGYR